MSEWPFGTLKRGHYGVIYADPPWPFATWSHKGKGRSGEAHYKTMSHIDIGALPVADLAAPDCILFIWVVQTQLPQALEIIKKWGFIMKSVAFCWIKADVLPLFPQDVVTHMGLGKWTRAEFEQCWLASRGKPKRLNANVRQTIDERRRQHSRKPDNAYERIERLVAGPYVELFARTRRPGWDAWGNETDKFAAPLSAAEDAADSLLSYNAAVMAIGERVKAGAPVPKFMLSQRKAPP